MAGTFVPCRVEPMGAVFRRSAASVGCTPLPGTAPPGAATNRRNPGGSPSPSPRTESAPERGRDDALRRPDRGRARAGVAERGLPPGEGAA